MMVGTALATSDTDSIFTKTWCRCWKVALSLVVQLRLLNQRSVALAATKAGNASSSCW